MEYKAGTIREDSWGLRKHRHRRQESSNVTKPPLLYIFVKLGGMTPRLECNDDNNVQHNDDDDVIMEVVLMLTVIQILNLSFDPSTGLKREELRRQRSNTISNILVIILMSAVSLKMFRRSIKKSFYE